MAAALSGGPNTDVDGDGFPNWRDTDADGDGVLDGDEGRDDDDGDGDPNYLDADGVVSGGLSGGALCRATPGRGGGGAGLVFFMVLGVVLRRRLSAS